MNFVKIARMINKKETIRCNARLIDRLRKALHTIEIYTSRTSIDTLELDVVLPYEVCATAISSAWVCTPHERKKTVTKKMKLKIVRDLTYLKNKFLSLGEAYVSGSRRIKEFKRWAMAIGVPILVKDSGMINGVNEYNVLTTEVNEKTLMLSKDYVLYRTAIPCPGDRIREKRKKKPKY